VSEVTISDIVNTFPTISKANNQLRRATAYSVNDMVLCQSASDALIFICTTAGTTAIQEPKAYQTVTDGNTVTDGTAVFKAVSVSGQITQISKIGNLSSLNTTDKTSAVNAINEVNTKVSKTEDLISNSGDAYSPSKPYKVGELCIYNNVLYRCITACSAGSWETNQSCFTQDTLVNAVDSMIGFASSEISEVVGSASAVKVGNIRIVFGRTNSTNTTSNMKICKIPAGVSWLANGIGIGYSTNGVSIGGYCQINYNPSSGDVAISAQSAQMTYVAYIFAYAIV
jgi:hypothetical protein